MKLHNAMWPGLVGKEPGTDHPPISLERMIELTAKASVDGQKFDGIDLFLFKFPPVVEEVRAIARHVIQPLRGLA